MEELAIREVAEAMLSREAIVFKPMVVEIEHYGGGARGATTVCQSPKDWSKMIHEQRDNEA